MSTTENLKEAFAGESMANRKYLAFAKMADKEGFTKIAKLFRAAAYAETVHAHNHLRVLGEVKSTEENLQEAIAGETMEFNEMYPAFIEEAEKEGNKKAVRSFDLANQVEKVHAELYQKALENMDDNDDADYYVCEVCGYTVEGEAPERCPVCGAVHSKFSKVD
ncbi:rubrerythrin family protein [Methanococcoides methylutens]|uniref:Rubrerythrin n=1 Tax=Methanococcoides methylutens MM1 TaxID=1434104 RepID=A0A0E3X0D1_METMT|nr:rubrerythrin family protein [Methanococcoides methylutens]AKB85580.1 Rubrerythrin [Methanococcoides methylutens MM1]